MTDITRTTLRSLPMALLMLALAVAPAAAEDPYVTNTLSRCQAAQSLIAGSTVPDLFWDRWIVSGAAAGSSDRWPENVEPFVDPRVTVEYLVAGSHDIQGLTGVTPQGETWSAWVDEATEGCVVLRGTAASQTGDGGSMTATGAKTRELKLGQATFKLQLDESHRPEDEGDRIKGKPCKRGTQCKSGSCVQKKCT